MLSAKSFNGYILFTSLLAMSQFAIATVVERNCGKYIFQINILNGTEIYETKFELYYKEDGKEKKIFYKTDEVVFLYAICIKNKKNQDLMYFQESYGGNAGPEDMYGIFDPSAKRMLIQPSDSPKGNKKQVQKIIGYPPPRIGGKDDKSFFCCFRKQYRTPIEQE